MLAQPEALVSELQEDFVLDVRGASLAAIKDAVWLRQKSRELRAESKQLQVRSRMVNDHAIAAAGCAAELNLNLITA